jgi:hypothetical protein
LKSQHHLPGLLLLFCRIHHLLLFFFSALPQTFNLDSKLSNNKHSARQSTPK